MDEATFLVLNALYLRKMADRAILAECSGCRPDEVDRILAETEAVDLVIGLGTQYLLTDDGRRGVLNYYEGTYKALRDDPDLTSWYERFEIVNERFLRLVSAWQTAAPDGDADRDRLLERICRAVERHMAAVDELAARLPRYGRYGERFGRSLDRVDQGQLEYVTSPTVDSLHNIWFEFHEDVLALLGRPREAVG